MTTKVVCCFLFKTCSEGADEEGMCRVCEGSVPVSSKEVKVEIGHKDHDRKKCMKYYF